MKSKESEVLQSSSWETRSNNLRAFMTTIRAMEGGDYEKAIEIGLWHAVQQNEQPDEISQVILIGSAPANSEGRVRQKRAEFGENYWKKTKYGKPTYYATELEKLKAKNIPVHTFYLNDFAQANFREIARETGGRCEQLNIHSSKGVELLTPFVTKEVLRKTAREHAAVELDRAQYVRTTFTS